MRDRLPILIVEDEALIALDLAWAIEDAKDEVVGPVATVAEALKLLQLLQLLQQREIGAAVLDANLLDRDITPVALALIEKHIPFVIHSAIGVPDELRDAFPDLPQVRKPTPPAVVVAQLEAEIDALRLA
jgi:DNA-binding LytR/AlgR family response regulator